LRSSDMNSLASDINEIAAGLDSSVSARVRAEKMKTELITNVSHDLKTPLTSIISYVELLNNVEGLPQEARDYAQIIAKKSDRLKRLTQDLFDISKIQSGNEEITLERIDISLLVAQSLGEHDGEIKKSELVFCTNLEKELYILADGRKMSRVISNLMSNVLKYAMKNTRVFVSVTTQGGNAVIEFKNTSAYPMDFDASEIMGRFVRGDKSRSVEGNGLGLAIVHSYTEACGGTLQIVTDGDLFKAIISFPIIK
ncbi:MAG: HAMP domain-containing histidine kinase, partial [Clostridia bacterium]|nr:HAMP domain-containing histidine kinase [Clostridia bacterium]